MYEDEEYVPNEAQASTGERDPYGIGQLSRGDVGKLSESLPLINGRKAIKAPDGVPKIRNHMFKNGIPVKHARRGRGW